MTNLLEEPMETEILLDLMPKPKTEPESMQVFSSDARGFTADDYQWSDVSNAVNSYSELSIDDFEVLANSLALRHIPSIIMAMHIFNYLQSVTVNPNKSCWPWCPVSRNKKTEFTQKTRNYTIQNGFTPLFTHDH